MSPVMYLDLDFASGQLDSRRAAAGRSRLRAALRRCANSSCTPLVVGLQPVNGRPTLVCCPA